MKNIHTLRHIAGLYLDLYTQPRDLSRPLTPEQVKDAGVLFLDLITAHEAELLIEQQRQAEAETSLQPDYRDLVSLFIEKFEQDEGIADGMTEDRLYKASDLFLHYAAEHL